MKVRTSLTRTFQCSQERAFKAPILGDATQFLDGFWFQPGVVSFEEDETWGKPGGIRLPVTDGNWLTPSGRLCVDEVLKRVENQYWQWTVYDFKPRSLFFTTRGVGEWLVTAKAENIMEVTYVYTYHSRFVLLHPFTWLFTKTQIRGLMKKAIRGIQLQAESEQGFVYE